MPSMNKAYIAGHLGKDPELRMTTNQKPVCSFSVAASEKQKDKEYTEWFNVVVWGKYAEICVEQLKKGDPVMIDGKIKTRSWEGKDGRKNYTTEIHTFHVGILRRKNETQTTSSEKPTSTGNAVDDLPF